MVRKWLKNSCKMPILPLQILSVRPFRGRDDLKKKNDQMLRPSVVYA